MAHSLKLLEGKCTIRGNVSKRQSWSRTGVVTGECSHFGKVSQPFTGSYGGCYICSEAFPDISDNRPLSPMHDSPIPPMKNFCMSDKKTMYRRQPPDDGNDASEKASKQM